MCAIGSSLSAADVDNALQDPTLELLNSNGDTMAANNNWPDEQQSESSRRQRSRRRTLEAATVRTVPGGAYTAIVRGFDNGTGVGSPRYTIYLNSVATLALVPLPWRR